MSEMIQAQYAQIKIIEAVCMQSLSNIRIIFLICIILFSTCTLAAPHMIPGSIPVDLYIYKKMQMKRIYLQKVFLSRQAKAYMAIHAKNLNAEKVTANLLPANIELGMENVPVLDQGNHGTCVTFAVTATID